MRWRIYYSNGSTWDSVDDGPWDDAPQRGVLAVVEEKNGRREIRRGGDYYRLSEDTVICTEDRDDIIAMIGFETFESSIKFGRFVSDAAMRRLEKHIREDWGS